MSFSFRKREAAIADRVADVTRYAEFKQLVYALSAMQREKGFRSLAVLSCIPGEGKTLLCAALAMAFAEASQSRVLVVDTAPYHRPNSLILRQCLAPGESMIDFLPLEKQKIDTTEATRKPPKSAVDTETLVPTPPTDAKTGMIISLTEQNDQALIRQVAEEGYKQHGLVLLDTVPLTVKNKNNIDPLLVAHLADASVLVVSQKLLNSANLSETLKLVNDPSLHLLGLISNEDYSF